MKKILLIAAVTIASVSAHASKARLSALQDAKHIEDIQEVFQSEPDQALRYEAATVEFGGGTGAPEAEGGFIRKMGDSAWSMYLGRSSTTYSGAAALAAEEFGGSDTETTALNDAFAQDNTLQLTYASKMGEISWGAGLFYVSNDFKNGQSFGTVGGATTDFDADKKQDIMGLLIGANNGTWDVQLRQGLTGKTELNDVANLTNGTSLANGQDIELNSTNSTKLSGGYKMDTMYFHGAYEMSAGELKVNSAKNKDLDVSEITVGVINTHKKDGVDFFYGATVIMNTTKEDVGDTKDESTLVPLIVGVESEVNTWLTLRGSITQNLGLLSTSKPDGGSAASTADNTTTRLGAGFKWGKADVDAVIGTGSTGTFGLDDDGNNFANMSVTYTF